MIELNSYQEGHVNLALAMTEKIIANPNFVGSNDAAVTLAAAALISYALDDLRVQR
jgi:hypothetical protein